MTTNRDEHNNNDDQNNDETTELRTKKQYEITQQQHRVGVRERERERDRKKITSHRSEDKYSLVNHQKYFENFFPHLTRLNILYELHFRNLQPRTCSNTTEIFVR
jgi:microsomal dipeptidase-like Zn-dependent dipeptidase